MLNRSQNVAGTNHKFVNIVNIYTYRMFMIALLFMLDGAATAKDKTCPITTLRSVLLSLSTMILNKAMLAGSGGVVSQRRVKTAGNVLEQ
jgi:hypothetical protein